MIPKAFKSFGSTMRKKKGVTVGALLILSVTQILMIDAISANSNRSVSAAASADLSFVPIGVDSIIPLGRFDFAIVNKGPDIAQNVVFRFPVPEGTGYAQIRCSVQSTCSLPPPSRAGEILCAFGDLPPSVGVQITIVLSIDASPGTRLSIRANVSSDTADINHADNDSLITLVVPGFPRIDSVRGLKNPFRIELTGQDLPQQFGGGSIGIGCDCARWPASNMGFDVVVIEGGTELKNKFPRNTPTKICYFDPLRGITLKTTFTR